MENKNNLYSVHEIHLDKPHFIEKTPSMLFCSLSMLNKDLKNNKNNLEETHRIATASILPVKNVVLNTQLTLNFLDYFDIGTFILVLIDRDIEGNKVEYLGYHLNKLTPDSKSLIVIKTSLRGFFSFDFMNHLYNHTSYDYLKPEKLNIKNSHILFGFKNLSWREVATLFELVNVSVSGGSNTKKHLFSPNHFRMSIMLMCVLGLQKSHVSIAEAFHKTPKEEYGKFNNFEESPIEIIGTDGTNVTNGKKMGKWKSEIKDRLIEIIQKEKLKDFQERLKMENPEYFEKQIKINNGKIVNKSIFKQGDKKEFHSSVVISNNILDIIEAPKPLLPNKKDKGIKKIIANSTLVSYLDQIKFELESSKDPYDTQMNLELNWINLIENQLKNDKIFMRKNPNKIFNLLEESYITLNNLSENNYLNKKFPALKNKLNQKKFLILTLAICSSLYDKIGYNALAVKVGNDVLYHIFESTRNKNLTNKSNTIRNFNEFKLNLNIELKQVVQIGDFYINLLTQYPHEAFHRDIKLNSYYTQEPYKLKINSEYLKELRENMIISPNDLPMICQPRVWSENSYGGYLTNIFTKNDIITGSHFHEHNMENKKNLYATINTVNSIKFSINTLFLDYISNEGSYLLKEVEASDDFQRYLTIKIAETYRNLTFYLPTLADWRGRIYAQSFFLTYQGNDLSTALLNFSEGKDIKENEIELQKRYLYIYGANNHNIDNLSKQSISDRIEWVENNYEKIINLDKALILSAEKPFIFTAFCLNIRELHKNPFTKIKTPVFLDATCSGIQHLAALLKDFELGCKVNLNWKSENDIPEDIYTSLLNPINFAINQYGLNNIEYAALAGVEFQRKHLKKSIMTKVYNVSTFGIKEQVKSGLVKVLDPQEFANEQVTEELVKIIPYKNLAPGKNGSVVPLNDLEIFKISELINNEIFIVYPSLNYIYSYFMDIAKLMMKLGLPLNWITPSDLNISQKYLKSNKTSIGISLFNKTRKLVVKEKTDKIDKIKQKQAIIPNIIHSLDASHLSSLINSAEKESFGPIVTIHDCFGTLPIQMAELEQKVRKEFILIYSKKDFLLAFHKNVIQTIKAHNYKIETNKKGLQLIFLEDGQILSIPKLPKLGKLDLENIKNATYMIT